MAISLQAISLPPFPPAGLRREPSAPALASQPGEQLAPSRPQEDWQLQAAQLRQRSFQKPAPQFFWPLQPDSDPEKIRMSVLSQVHPRKPGLYVSTPESVLERANWEETPESQRGGEMAFQLAFDELKFFGGSQPRVAERVRYAMERPDRVLHYLSATPEGNERAFVELHRQHYAENVGMSPERVGPALETILKKNSQNEADPGSLAKLTATSVIGMRAHVASLVNAGKLKEADRQKMLRGVDQFYADLQKKQPELYKASRALDTLTAPGDKHLPDLDETFELARRYPGKLVLLDTKTSGEPALARRMAEQLRDKLKLDINKDLRDRVVIMNPDTECLRQFKDVFASEPALKDFRNYSWDDEKLNDVKIPLIGFVSSANRSPLSHSNGNMFVSIGNPRSPAGGNFEDLVFEVERARRHIDKPNSPYHDKQLLVWTLNDQAQIEKIVKAGADGVLTDDPQAMTRTLDKMQAAGQLKHRPLVIAHRGGPASKEYPENTLNAMRAGYEHADAIEIDLVSTTDGILILHDNNPNDPVAVYRNQIGESDNPWHPIFANKGSPFRRRTDYLSSAEVRDNFYLVLDNG